MGLFSWFAETGKKSAAAAHIQQYFEISRSLGTFKGDPAKIANEVTAHVCDQSPTLLKVKVSGQVFAIAVLLLAVRDDGLPVVARDHFAMALQSMLEPIHRDGRGFSAQERDVLDSARSILETFRAAVPTMSAVMAS